MNPLAITYGGWFRFVVQLCFSFGSNGQAPKRWKVYTSINYNFINDEPELAPELFAIDSGSRQKGFDF
jgi:hypothetical protein